MYLQGLNLLHARVSKEVFFKTDFGTKLKYLFFLKKKGGIIKTLMWHSQDAKKILKSNICRCHDDFVCFRYSALLDEVRS